MCFPNLGVCVLGNTPALACAYYVNACRRAPQRRVRGKGLCSCNKSDATRLLQLLWIRSLPCLSSLQAITCKVRLKHTYTHVHTHVSHKSMCSTILVPRAARVGPSTTPLHTHHFATLFLLSHAVRVCVSRVKCASTRASAWFEVDARPTAEHQSGAMWCLPYTRTRSTLAQDPRYACSLAFWCLRHVLDCVLRGSDRVLSHVQSPGTSSLCTGTQKKAIFRHVLKIATRGLSQGLFKESHTS